MVNHSDLECGPVAAGVALRAKGWGFSGSMMQSPPKTSVAIGVRCIPWAPNIPK